MADPKKREKILMLLSGVAVVAFVFNQFVCGGESASPPPQATKAAAEQKAKSEGKRAEKPDEKKTRRPRRKQVEFVTWGRNPFVETFRLAKFDSTALDSSNFVLRGVIQKGNEAYVLIGDEILKEGEQRGDLTILEIDRNRVICKKRGRILTLLLNDEP